MATPANIFHISTDANMFNAKQMNNHPIFTDKDSLPREFNQIQ